MFGLGRKKQPSNEQRSRPGLVKRQHIQPITLANTGEYYEPVPDYGHQAIPLSVWRLGRKRPPQDFWGNTGRVYNEQLLTLPGPLLFALDRGITTGQGGTGVSFGQYVSMPVMGFAGRPSALTQTSAAMEWNQVNGIAYNMARNVGA